MDRQIRACNTREFSVVIPTRVANWLAEGPDMVPTGPSFRYGRYRYEVLSLPRAEVAAEPLMVGAWCYEGGWIEDERVGDHIVLGLKVMWWLARAWHGR